MTFRVRKSHLYVGFGLVVGFGLGYATATTIQRRALTPPPVAEAPAFSELPVSTVSTEGRPSLGPADAPVTVVEFSDYQCPYCRRFFEETYHDLLERYEGRLRYVLRNFPIRNLHPLAHEAAEAAECAHDQGRFWEYHDLLFARSPALGAPSLEAYAAQLGLDAEAFATCLSSGRKADVVDGDVQDGIRYGVAATPTFFINGRIVVGALSLERFSTYVDAALREAESAVSGPGQP